MKNMPPCRNVKNGWELFEASFVFLVGNFMQPCSKCSHTFPSAKVSLLLCHNMGNISCNIVIHFPRRITKNNWPEFTVEIHVSNEDRFGTF